MLRNDQVNHLTRIKLFVAFKITSAGVYRQKYENCVHVPSVYGPDCSLLSQRALNDQEDWGRNALIYQLDTIEQKQNHEGQKQKQCQYYMHQLYSNNFFTSGNTASHLNQLLVELWFNFRSYQNRKLFTATENVQSTLIE